MKKIGVGICSLLVAAMGMIGCNQEHTTYTEGNYILFSDSMTVLPVQDNEEQFEIIVAATKAADYDRSVGVEVLANRSNAIEGKHYTLPSQTVTIPAGAMTGKLILRGISDNIAVSDSLGITLRLINQVTDSWAIYGENGQQAKVLFRKACPFNLDQFSGYCAVRSAFYDEYMVNTPMRLIEARIDAKRENTIILKDLFYKGFDIRVRLDNTNILRPNVYMDESQQIGTTAEAFGTIYGNGKLMSFFQTSYTSYYSSCEEFIAIYPTLYVDGVGTVGTFTTLVKFITDEEYEVYKKLGY
ncbi:MAG: DUF4984 domain-containing protein [Phocaeicola sp.]